jgi:hypothetical protein
MVAEAIRDAMPANSAANDVLAGIAALTRLLTLPSMQRAPVNLRSTSPRSVEHRRTEELGPFREIAIARAQDRSRLGPLVDGVVETLRARCPARLRSEVIQAQQARRQPPPTAWLEDTRRRARGVAEGCPDGYQRSVRPSAEGDTPRVRAAISARSGVPAMYPRHVTHWLARSPIQQSCTPGENGILTLDAERSCPL